MGGSDNHEPPKKEERMKRKEVMLGGSPSPSQLLAVVGFLASERRLNGRKDDG
jgi:hypothetical protein